jgi:hypothetical protein
MNPNSATANADCVDAHPPSRVPRDLERARRGPRSALGPADRQSDESLVTARKVLQLDDDKMERVFERATEIVPQILSI